MIELYQLSFMAFSRHLIMIANNFSIKVCGDFKPQIERAAGVVMQLRNLMTFSLQAISFNWGA